MISNTNHAVHVSFDALRIGIGILGLFLPFVLFLGVWGFEPSISDYYYTNMRDYLEGVLFFLAFFLAAYRPYGEDGWKDNWITNLAALSALLLALFPTYNPHDGHMATDLVFRFVSPEWSGYLHNTGSGGLFVCFAILSTFFFTKGTPGQSKSFRKLLRNACYFCCGVGIAACIVFIGWCALTAPPGVVANGIDIFWPESIALVLFGFSWLVKGGAVLFLNDK